MANDEPKKSLPERIKEGVRETVGEWLEALEGLMAPAPQLVPVPVRRPQRGRR